MIKSRLNAWIKNTLKRLPFENKLNKTCLETKYLNNDETRKITFKKLSNNEDLCLKGATVGFTQSIGADIDLSYLEGKTADLVTKQQTATNQLLNELLLDINSIKAPSIASTNNNGFELILTPQFSNNNQFESSKVTSNSTLVIKTNIDPNSSKIGHRGVDLIDKLPNLNFIKSKVLMFPANK